jgi:histidyl-tRNA synthetase
MDKVNFAKECEVLRLLPKQISMIENFMFSDFETLGEIIPEDILKSNQGYIALTQLRKLLSESGISKYCVFDPSIIRGFDYSDGLVYEVYDKNQKNRRSLFGGERFDKLVDIFGNFDLPATGFAMGDWTLLEFLKNWNLLPDSSSNIEYFITLWPGSEAKYIYYTVKMAKDLREAGFNVFMWLQNNTKLDKQLKYADKKGYKYALIAGENEINKDEITVKNLQDGSQYTISYNEFLKQTQILNKIS